MIFFKKKKDALAIGCQERIIKHFRSCSYWTVINFIMVTVTAPCHHTHYDSTLHHVLVLIYFKLVVEMYATFTDIKPIYLFNTTSD